MKTIYLADSREWYETSEQARAYLDLMNQGYASGIVRAEDELLKKNLEQICDALPEKICYIDLGPGDGRKTRFLCGAFQKAGKLSAYVAVDVQPEFLKIAEEIGRRFHVPSRALNMSFEDFLEQTRSEDIFASNPKFIYLGVTYGNFLNEDIEPRLRRFMSDDGLLYVSAGTWPQNPEELISAYEGSIEIFRPLIKKHRLDEGGKMKIRFNPDNSSIQQGYETDSAFYVFGISKKPTVLGFKRQVSKYFDGNFFIEKNHIGFLGKKKK